MAWHLTGDKPLSEPMMACFTDEYMPHSTPMSWYICDVFHFCCGYTCIVSSLWIPVIYLPDTLWLRLWGTGYVSNSQLENIYAYWCFNYTLGILLCVIKLRIWLLHRLCHQIIAKVHYCRISKWMQKSLIKIQLILPWQLNPNFLSLSGRHGVSQP